MTGGWTSAKGDTTGVVLGALEGGACLAAAGPCCCSALDLHMRACVKGRLVQGDYNQLVALSWLTRLQVASGRTPYTLPERACHGSCWCVLGFPVPAVALADKPGGRSPCSSAVCVPSLQPVSDQHVQQSHPLQQASGEMWVRGTPRLLLLLLLLGCRSHL